MQASFLLEERLSEQEVKDLALIHEKIQTFIADHPDKLITVVTSGGTSVPLEKRAVRFI